MKRLFVCTALLSAATLLAQTPPPTPMHQGQPKSPPATESATLAGKHITITYNSPRVRGREGKIFTKDGLISHDPQYPIWRAGANAATTLETDGNLTIGGLSVPAGKYTLFVDLSDAAHWMLIVNKQTGEWGLSHDPAQDLGKVKMSMKKTPALVEELKYTITPKHRGKGTLTLVWEDVSASVPIAVQ